jgi:hypothetical protein
MGISLTVDESNRSRRCAFANRGPDRGEEWLKEGEPGILSKIKGLPTEGKVHNPRLQQFKGTMSSYRQIYMGYGSNMMRRQMSERAPESQFIGLAFLRGW